MEFRQKTLSNGLELVAERNTEVQSIAFGFYVKTGSRDESPELSGVSHFLEHMVFKGNDQYRADDVNRIFDELGANYNAATGEESTVFYAAVLPEYFEAAIRLFGSILFPSLRDADFDMEKNVILEEIGMYADQPSFVAYDHAMQAYFGHHPVGKPVLGTIESVTSLTAQQMRDYHAAHYRAGNITLAVAGRFEFEQIDRLVDEICGHWPAGSTQRPTLPVSGTPGDLAMSRDESQLEQVMCLGPAPGAHDPRRFAAELLSVIVGDDNNSRFHWRLVDPGLAESAEFSFNEYDDTGTYLTYLSCEPDRVAENLAIMNDIFAELGQTGVTEAELQDARNKLVSRIVLRAERPMGRMSSLGGNWMTRREFRSIEDDLKLLQSISSADLRAVLDAFPLTMTTRVGVGPRTSLV